MDSVGEESRIVKGESRGEEGGVEEQPDEVFNGFIRFIGIGFLLEFNDNWVIRVQFHGLFRLHITGHGGISEGLGFHDSFHIGGPSMFSGDQDTGGFVDSVTNNDFFNFFSQDFFN